MLMNGVWKFSGGNVLAKFSMYWLGPDNFFLVEYAGTI